MRALPPSISPDLGLVHQELGGAAERQDQVLGPGQGQPHRTPFVRGQEDKGGECDCQRGPDDQLLGLRQLASCWRSRWGGGQGVHLEGKGRSVQRGTGITSQALVNRRPTCPPSTSNGEHTRGEGGRRKGERRP